MKKIVTKTPDPNVINIFNISSCEPVGLEKVGGSKFILTEQTINDTEVVEYCLFDCSYCLVDYEGLEELDWINRNELIKSLIAKGYKAFVFDNHKELYQWVAETMESKSETESVK